MSLDTPLDDCLAVSYFLSGKYTMDNATNEEQMSIGIGMLGIGFLSCYDTNLDPMQVMEHLGFSEKLRKVAISSANGIASTGRRNLVTIKETQDIIMVQ